MSDEEQSEVTFTFRRCNSSEDVVRGMEYSKREMQRQGVWRDDITLEEWADWAGSHVHVQEQMQCEFGSALPVAFANVTAHTADGKEIEIPRCSRCDAAKQMVISRVTMCWLASCDCEKHEDKNGRVCLES